MSNLAASQKYYRLPWSLSDNAISWLEVTTSCNLSCAGCYRPKAGGHKTLDEIADDLAVFRRERKSDCMSVAGGDPLVHPRIVEIVRMIRQGGWKPVINTNGLALKPALLRQLKEAGVFGFTFHIDTSQKRMDSQAGSEKGHNPLRQKFAEMIAQEGGISCSFNQTVTSDTLQEIPEVVRWARENPNLVHTVVFILYREPRLAGDFEYYAHGRRVPLDEIYEQPSQWGGVRPLRAQDVIQKIREIEPMYEASAYLNGTEEANSTKWLLATRIGDSRETYGFVSPRFMELVQHGHRYARGRWLSYSHPNFVASGRSAMVALGWIDSRMRKLVRNYLSHGLKSPVRFLRKAHLQTFTIIQPIDILPDGRMSMCDSCPDLTVYRGKMYWSCRLEEIKKYGTFVSAVPRRTQTEGPPGT